MLLSTGPPFCLHILHCPSKGLSRNWADFWNLKLEYLTNYWSDLSEINCNGFSFKSPLIWYTSFNQRHRAIFGCCIATRQWVGSSLRWTPAATALKQNNLPLQGHWGKRDAAAGPAHRYKTPTQSKRKRNQKEKVNGTWPETCIQYTQS